MAALNVGARRLEQRARVAEIERAPGQSASPTPAQELQQAKWALRDSERRLGLEMEAVWVPIRVGMRSRPWRTLALSVAAGGVYGWADGATRGALSRLTWRVLRTSLSGHGLRMR